MSLLLTLNIFHTLLYSWFWSCICFLELENKTITVASIIQTYQKLRIPFFHNFSNYFKFPVTLKLTSRGILHYLCSTNLSKIFSQLIVSIFIFSRYFFQQILPGGKVWVYSLLLISYSLTLNYCRYFILPKIDRRSNIKFIKLKELTLKIWLENWDWMVFQIFS